MECFKTNCTFLKFIFGDTLYTLCIHFHELYSEQRPSLWQSLIYIGWQAHLPSEMLTNSEASTALQWKCQFLELKIDCLVCAMSLCDKLNIFISHNLCWQNKFWQFVVPYLAPSISALSLLSEHCPVRSLVVISLLLEVHFILHPPHFAILQFCNLHPRLEHYHQFDLNPPLPPSSSLSSPSSSSSSSPGWSSGANEGY